jgi:hypothetical protein
MTNTKKILVLDDAIFRHRAIRKLHLNDHIVNCSNIWEAQEAIKNEVFDKLFLDFDLNDFNENSAISNGETSLYLTGEDFLTYYLIHVPRKNWVKECVIISTNDRGAREIEWILNQVGIPNNRMPLVE